MAGRCKATQKREFKPIKWIQTGRLSAKNSLSRQGPSEVRFDDSRQKSTNWLKWAIFIIRRSDRLWFGWP